MTKLRIGKSFPLDKLDLVIKGRENTDFLGNYKSVFRGGGLEFSDYRPYVSSNDDASRIDWKASRRTGQILIKEFEEERNADIIFLLDVSSQMLTGSTNRLKAEYAAEMISSLCRSAVNAGDSVGLVLFSNKIIKEIRPERGMVQIYRIAEEISTVSNYGGYSDMNLALNHVFKKAEEGSLVIVVSDFIYGIQEENSFKTASKKFDLILAAVRDPGDSSLPGDSGEVLFEDPSSGETLLVNPSKIKEEFSKIVRNEMNEIKRLAERYGADFLLLETDKPYLKELLSFFRRRASRWR